ncbi:hypothetical protein BRC85_00840 [Halobacteriales archaeon QS_1_69_70]|nr:MAG: hypothetical protein BRC85_00840 [Halobacteriales archaeon QS_1_69_70]
MEPRRSRRRRCRPVGRLSRPRRPYPSCRRPRPPCGWTRRPSRSRHPRPGRRRPRGRSCRRSRLSAATTRCVRADWSVPRCRISSVVSSCWRVPRSVSVGQLFEALQ